MTAHFDYFYNGRRSFDIKKRWNNLEDKATDTLLNYVESSVVEENTRFIDSLANGSDTSNTFIRQNVMAMFTYTNNPGWLNIDQSIRANQLAHGAVLDHYELALVPLIVPPMAATSWMGLADHLLASFRNCFAACRCYISPIFSKYQLKDRSGFVKMIWAVGMVKVTWPIIVKTYSIVRDEVGSDLVRDYFIANGVCF
ncbi:hypothetical protein SLS54_008110 [Diplodia seriata]